MQAVFGTKFQPGELCAKADATNLRVIVLEREVEMARLRGVGVGDFSFDENVGELACQQIADAPSEVTYRPDGAAEHQREVKGFGPGAGCLRNRETTHMSRGST